MDGLVAGLDTLADDDVEADWLGVGCCVGWPVGLPVGDGDGWVVGGVWWWRRR